MDKNNIILEKILLEYKEKEDLETPLKSFKLHKKLNKDVWDGFNMKPEIREKLLVIANDFYEGLDIDKNISYVDIILTGSLANMNHSQYSDFDLHIMMDFTQVNEDFDLVKSYFNEYRKNWNKDHDIEILGYEVELYLQDKDEPHVASGLYSILNNEWLIKPSPFKDEIDITSVRKKSEEYIKEIEELETMYEDMDFDEFMVEIKRVWDKIKNGRKAGLEEGGELSVENIVFKLLRRNGAIEKIIEMKSQKYDEKMSME